MVFYLPLLERLRKKNRKQENQEPLQIQIENSLKISQQETNVEKEESIVIIEIL